MPTAGLCACLRREAFEPGLPEMHVFAGVSLARSDSMERRSARITSAPTQRKFVEMALRFHPLDQFTIIEVDG